MVCEPWKERLDTYLDGELPEEEMRSLDAHVHSLRLVLGRYTGALADET